MLVEKRSKAAIVATMTDQMEAKNHSIEEGGINGSQSQKIEAIAMVATKEGAVLATIANYAGRLVTCSEQQANMIPLPSNWQSTRKRTR